MIQEVQYKDPNPPPISQEQLTEALRPCPIKTAVGADFWIPRMWLQLPPEGQELLRRVVQYTIHNLVLPLQCLLNLVVFLGKGQGGERPITLTAGLYRLLCRLFKDDLVQWENDNYDEFDKARRGQSAEKVAMKRGIITSLHRSIGNEVVTILWDLEKFFDTVRPQYVAQLALARGYPPRLLALGMLVHTAARTLCLNDATSTPSMPWTSILAGCMQSMAFAKVFLQGMLSDLNAKYSPTSFESWVDDVNQSTAGPKAIVRTQAPAAARSFVVAARALGCRISSKSTIVASSLELARHVQKQLAPYVRVEVATHGRDLGIDYSATKRRSIHVFAKRMKLAKARLRRIKAIAKKHKEAKKLVKTGFKPQATWGHAAKGMSPTAVRQYRANFATAQSSWRHGTCSTTLLAITQYPMVDPGVALRADLFHQWFQAVHDMPKLRLQLKRHWNVLRPKLQGPTRWSRVHDQMGAVIATLVDLGWQPVWMDLWTSPSGECCKLDYGDPSLGYQFEQELKQHMVADLWRHAATHFDGAGLESGPDLASLTKLRKRMDAQPERRGLLDAIASGGMWPAARCAAAGYEQPNVCQHCGHSPCDSWHVYWGCPRHDDSQQPAVQKSQHLKDQALAEPHLACLWLRGLLPKALLGDYLRKYHPGEFAHAWGLFQHAEVIDLPPGAAIGTDASGGHYTSEPRLRLVGYGVVLSSRSGHVLGALQAMLPGEQQTVPRGELQALVEALARTRGDVTVYVDASYVTKGWLKRRGSNQFSGSNLDLWQALANIRRTRQGKVTIVKVTSHRDAASLEGNVDPLGFLLNELADSLAESAAKRVQYPDHCKAELDRLEHQAHLIRMRLLAIGGNEVRQHRPRSDQQSRQQAKEAKQVRSITALTALAEKHHHQPKWRHGILTCTACSQKATSKKHAWVKQQCPGRWPPQLHPSHHGTAKYYRGILVCTRCGRWAHKKLRSLTLECSPPTYTGKLVLSRLAQGRVWHGLAAWPE